MKKKKLTEVSARRLKIRMRIRKRIHGTADRPRLSVYKSNTATYVQLIDDWTGHTIAASSTKKIANQTGTPVEKAVALGKEIGEKAIEKGIQTIVFDRSGYIYHGRVKAIAEGARATNLKF
jgi:large subunit ribosomal protein L18